MTRPTAIRLAGIGGLVLLGCCVAGRGYAQTDIPITDVVQAAERMTGADVLIVGFALSALAGGAMKYLVLPLVRDQREENAAKSAAEKAVGHRLDRSGDSDALTAATAAGRVAAEEAVKALRADMDGQHKRLRASLSEIHADGERGRAVLHARVDAVNDKVQAAEVEMARVGGRIDRVEGDVRGTSTRLDALKDALADLRVTIAEAMRGKP